MSILVGEEIPTEDLHKNEKRYPRLSHLKLAHWNRPCETSRKWFIDADWAELNTYE